MVMVKEMSADDPGQEGHWNLKAPLVKPLMWNSLLNSIANNENNAPCHHLHFVLDKLPPTHGICAVQIPLCYCHWGGGSF